jgi:hypothetical protein
MPHQQQQERQQQTEQRQPVETDGMRRQR